MFNVVKNQYDRRKFLVLTALGSTMLPIEAQARAPSATSARKRGWIPSQPFLDELPVLMHCASLPGLSMAVIKRGKVSWTHTLGVINADTKEPVREDSLFEAASMSKPLFAYGVLQLVEAGKLDLDTPLVKYYTPPHISNIPDNARISKITARHVLTHTTGLPNWGSDSNPETLVPAFEPGRYYSYSGEGFFWLQLVVEHITELGLDAFMRTHLFEPAGMTRSMYSWGEDELPNLAFGHQHGRAIANKRRELVSQAAPVAQKWGIPIRDWNEKDWVRAFGEIMPSPDRKRFGFQNAAASLITTAKDYAHFLTLVMDHDKREPWEISRELRQEMISPAVPIQEGVPLWWGLGWAIERPAEGVRFGHEGNNDNLFTAYSGGDPKHGNGLVVLTNDGSGFGVYQRIVRDATGYDQLTFISDNSPPREI